jgi:hypothetical protein
MFVRSKYLTMFSNFNYWALKMNINTKGMWHKYTDDLLTGKPNLYKKGGFQTISNRVSVPVTVLDTEGIA